MFKLAYCLAVAGVSLLMLSGCNSETTATSATNPQRMVQPSQDKSLPAPAQGLAAQQEQQKRQMDSMRAADALKAGGH